MDDRVLTADGREGMAGLISNDGLTTLVQINEPFGLGVAYVRYEVRSLVKVNEEKTPPAR
jgi:hypothetical protein